MRLSVPELTELADAAAAANLTRPGMREVLLGQVNGQFVATQMDVPSLPPKMQLMSDLQALARVDRLSDGSVPLRDWLEMAEATTRGLEQNAVFGAALARLTRQSSGAPSVPAREDLPEAKEKIVHQDDMVSVGFLAGGTTAGRSVARLRVPRHEGGRAVESSPGMPILFQGTGWVIGERLLMTNHHVVNAREDGEPPARDEDLLLQGAGTHALFGFDDENLAGEEVGFERLEAWDAELDYAIMRSAQALPRPPLALNANRLPNLEHGYIPVNIIQHPGGHAKKVALRNNLVTASDPTDLRYFTDTRGGSSGSPVFDDDWRVVALHRASEPRNDLSFQGRSTAWVNIGTQIAAIVEQLDDDLRQKLQLS